MAKVSTLSNILDPESTDELYLVRDPDGSPTSHAIALSDLKDWIAPTPHYGHMQRITTNQTLPNNSLEKVLFNTIVTSHGLTTTDSKFTITRAGVYHLYGQATIDAPGYNAQVYIRKNGTSIHRAVIAITTTSAINTISLQYLASLAVGDVIDLAAFQVNGSSASGTINVGFAPQLIVREIL